MRGKTNPLQSIIRSPWKSVGIIAVFYVVRTVFKRILGDIGFFIVIAAVSALYIAYLYLDPGTHTRSIHLNPVKEKKLDFHPALREREEYFPSFRSYKNSMRSSVNTSRSTASESGIDFDVSPTSTVVDDIHLPSTDGLRQRVPNHHVKVLDSGRKLYLGRSKEKMEKMKANIAARHQRSSRASTEDNVDGDPASVTSSIESKESESITSPTIASAAPGATASFSLAGSSSVSRDQKEADIEVLHPVVEQSPVFSNRDNVAFRLPGQLSP